jgi:hypothetical protein
MDRGWILESKYHDQMTRFGVALQSCLEKYLSVSEFLSVAHMGDGLPRAQVVDVLRRWYQHVLPSRGVRLWDIIDNDESRRGRPGTFSLYTNEEVIYLFKDKDSKVASIFEEAKLSATQDLVEFPNFETDITELDGMLDRLVAVATEWIPPLGGVQ